MSADSIGIALAQLELQINDCEKAVIKSIEDKKQQMPSLESMPNSKINSQLQHNPIAIVGMASIFPEAKNIQQYWQNIVNEIDCITDIPATHWNVDDYYDPNPRTKEDKTYCKKGGFIPQIDFNPLEFGIPPNILEVTDVSQLLSLVVAKAAMTDAGYAEDREFDREMVGVILGSAALKLGAPLSARLQYPIWEKALRSSGVSQKDTQKIIEKIQSAYVKWDENAFPGTLSNVIAGRIANRLNLGGINCTVDAACASSFGALKMAVSELVEHRTDMMITGGVDTDNSINAYISFSKTPAVSAGDKVKPFDASSDGMMLGEGIGMVVLKRLADAQRDNDRIYAVIKGIGTSSDGRFKSIYAPRKEGQIKALRRAYADAGMEPETVGLIEAHGTGTMAGDPTEFGSLREFFSETDRHKEHIALGSVKSQIGHTKAAAGAASLIKVALALHHKILPATINVTEPNPKLNIKNSAFYLNTKTRPWIRSHEGTPRRAGVSSFGFGGTNYHIVLEEYTSEHNSPYRLHGTPAPILLFAETPEKLLSKCEEISAQLQTAAADRVFIELAQSCKSQDIPTDAARVGFVAATQPEACKLLKITIDFIKKQPCSQSWEHPTGIYYRTSGMELDGKVVALFSGQGSQYLNMGRELVINFPQMRELYGYMDSLLLQENLKPLSEVVYPPRVFSENEENAQIAALQRTEYAQPAIGMISAGLYKVLQQAGFKADFFAGHSFGELTALWAAGVLNEADYCALVKARGQAMAAPKDPNYDTGAMVAVKEDFDKIADVVKRFRGVKIANLNSPRQVVLAGPTQEIHELQQTLHNSGHAAVVLPVAAAFHTPLIAFAQKAFAIATKSVTFHPPQTPVYTNVTGKQYSQQPGEIHKTLETHLANSVLFKQEIENIYADGGNCFVEFGPRKILTNLVKDTLGSRPHMAIALNASPRSDSDRALRQAVVQLRVAGMSLTNLDPYQIFPQIEDNSAKKGITVKLNGTNYICEKTKTAYEQALLNGHRVEDAGTAGQRDAGTAGRGDNGTRGQRDAGTTGRGDNGTRGQRDAGTTGRGDSGTRGQRDAGMKKPEEMGTQEHSPDHPITASPRHPLPASSFTPTLQVNPESKMETTSNNNQQILESLEFVLTQFQQNQSENLQVHSEYLKHQMEYAKTFFQLMQQQNTLFAKGSDAEAAKLKSTIMPSLERSMMQFHNQQSDTLRVHEQYLNDQVEYTHDFFQLLQLEYKQIVDGVAPTATPAPQITSKQNGATDAIAKPDVVAPQPHTPKQDFVATPIIEKSEPHSEIATNGSNAKVVPFVKQELVTDVATDKVMSITDKLSVSESEHQDQLALEVTQELSTNNLSVSNSENEEVTDKSSVANTHTVDLSKLSETLLAITSDKTGYPVEMLDMDMDMEADLGIDSIKRVEILGGLQEVYPELPQPNLEELAEQRTIGQIVEYLQSVNGVATVQTATLEETKEEIKTISAVPVETPPAPVSVSSNGFSPAREAVTKTTAIALAEPAAPVNTVDDGELSAALLNITSDKTGYPVEMLELDMDMEADLGIDSIKRVEILGAMQEMYPDLPQPDNLEELSEQRTIGQVVEYLQSLTGGEKKKLQPKLEPQPQPIREIDGVVRRQAKLQPLPEPDFLEFALPSGHIALITDDGSLTTSQVAETLSAQGWKVVVLSFPDHLVSSQSLLPLGVERVSLSDLSEEHLQTQLNKIATNYGHIAAFVHIHPVFGATPNGSVPYFPQEKAIVKQVFFIAKHLKQSLTSAAKYTRAIFCTVTRLDGAFGVQQQVNFGAIAAGLFGLTKTLTWEWGGVFCRAIDISPQINPEQAAYHIQAELHDPNLHISEVAYGDHKRVTMTVTS